MRIAGTMWAVALCVSVGSGGAASQGSTEGARRIAFTTSSTEAKAQAAEAIRRIENFQPGAQVQEAAKKAVEADPEFAFGHYLVGAGTPPPQARPHLDKAVELSKKASDGERRYIEAVMLNRAQKRDEAIAALNKLKEDYPQERMIYMMLGQIYSGQGKLHEAKAAFEKAIELDGSTARAYALIGNVHLLKGDYGKARELFKTAMAKRAPGTAPGTIHYGLAFSHLYEGNADRALATLNGFLEEYRKNAGSAGLPEVFIWNSMGRINLENGRLEEAMKAYEKGFESVPGSSLSEQDKKIWLGRLHHGRGRTLARMGKHQEAWREAETIKKMIDENGEQGKRFVPAYHYLAGYLKLEAGDHASAIEQLKQADQTDPFNKLLLARAYEKAGDKVSARKAYQEIVDSTQNSIERALAYPEAKKRLGAL